MAARTDQWRPARDRRAVRHPARPGRPQPDGDRPSALVVGGGLAGLAAATALSERGVAVTVLEREAQLGGRVRAWPVGPDDEVGPRRTMSRGFHAFFRQYYNLRALLRRADPALSRLGPIEDYPLVSAAGGRDSFTKIPHTPPLNLMAFVARSPSFTARDLARVDGAAAMELLDVEFPATFSAYDGESAAHFLDRLRFPEAARHLALEVFARSFFAHPDDFSAGELVAMFHSYFLGSAEGLLFDVPDDDYDTALWAPLGRYLHRRGVDVRTSVSVRAIGLDDDGAGVELEGGETLRADALVLAADPATTRELLGAAAGVDGEGAQQWRERVAGVRLAPPFAVWRLWLDRRAASARSPFLGTSGFGPLDNVSLLERFEAGARVWSEGHDGSVVELHAYAVDDPDPAVLQPQLRAALTRVYPELAEAQTVAQEWLVRRDCPLAGTGPWTDRLEVRTPHQRLVLAGDGIRCDYPVALMERATTTGFLAANQLLADWDLAGHELWTVPMAGRHPYARRAAQKLREPAR